jgi:hypothetical protein
MTWKVYGKPRTISVSIAGSPGKDLNLGPPEYAARVGR